jgi:CheY-like chemotaxis protein
MVGEACEPTDQPCILVVDDDADLVAFLFSILKQEGFSIVAASHGQQALDLLEHGLRPHVILIDLMLPRVSGTDVLHHIRTDPALRAIPRIVITGSDDGGAIVADAIFRKPFDNEELIATIHRLVESGGSTSTERFGPRTTRDAAHEAPRQGRDFEEWLQAERELSKGVRRR